MAIVGVNRQDFCPVFIAILVKKVIEDETVFETLNKNNDLHLDLYRIQIDIELWILTAFIPCP